MTQQPRIEARVSAQERRQINLDARLEELSEDMVASFAQQTAYQVGIEQKIDALKEDVDARLHGISESLDKFQEDMIEMEDRILSAFQQLVTIIDQRLPEKGESN